jgi:hypothetical protein
MKRDYAAVHGGDEPTAAVARAWVKAEKASKLKLA